MNNYTTEHPVLYALKAFFNKFRQNPDIYPIKFYKKVNRRRRRPDMYK